MLLGGGVVVWEGCVGEAEEAGIATGFLPVLFAGSFGEGADEGFVGGEHAVDEDDVDPEEGQRVHAAIGFTCFVASDVFGEGALDGVMKAVDVAGHSVDFMGAAKD